MTDARESLLLDFVACEQLPDTFATLAHRYYFPLLDWLWQQRQAVDGSPLLLGINGCQGSGKSTLAALIARALAAERHCRVAVLSIDDLYLTRQQRQTLARTVHPLLATRGVPGTHDIELGLDLLDRLCRGETTALPRFDKARDDRAPESEWPRLVGPADLIILEGWCVGSRPQREEQLLEPINVLERQEDPGGRWRHFANQSLYNYQPLFRRLHKLIMLKAPDFDCVYRWRLLQEQKLARQQKPGAQLMNEGEIARFVQHYERLTRDNLERLGASADVLFTLNDQHDIIKASYSS